MAKSKSWSVKGVAPETRDTARDAAQAAGLPIGAWIDGAILKAARGELPGLPGHIPAPSAEPGAPAGTTMEAGETPSAETPPSETPPPRPARAPVPPPKDRAVSEGHPAAPEGGPVAETRDAAGSASGEGGPERAPGPKAETHRLVARPTDRIDPDAQPVSEARPLRLPDGPRERPGLARYAAAAVLLVALLGGIAWILLDDPVSPPPSPAPPARTAAAPAADSRAAPSTMGSAEAGRGDTDPATAAAPSADLRTLVAEANAGKAEAQYNLGMLYLTGNQVAKNAAEAAKWFEKAAVTGLANAQFNLGVLYQQGSGVPENQQLAFFWYQSAAEQNFARAQHNLATAYAAGRGVPRNDAKAVEWFTRAAESGLAESQYSLGVIYERGLGTVQPDLAAARTWFSRAAAAGDPQSVARLAVIEERLGAQGASRDAPASEPKSARSPVDDRPLNRSEIRELQRLLNALNFDAGPADGQIGRRTTSAVRLYQQFAGFEETGAATRDLLDDLRAVAKDVPKSR